VELSEEEKTVYLSEEAEPSVSLDGGTVTKSGETCLTGRWSCQILVSLGWVLATKTKIGDGARHKYILYY
jgi:hypothetical protein